MNVWVQKSNTKKTMRGFTIVELLIVIIVIAILATITLVTYTGIQQRARDSARLTVLRTLVNGLEMHYVRYGYYPDACNSLNTGCEVSNLSSSLAPEFISKIPQDPGPGITVRYVTGGTPARWGYNYAIWLKYESQPACKYTRGENPPSGWWPDDPVCTI